MTSRSADAPLSQVLFRYVWPFWLFKDATRGDRYARAAAYRHNRDMRIHLPGYLARWVLVSAATLAFASGFSALSVPRAGAMNVFALLAAGSGIAFACCVCVLAVTSCIYLYLSRHEH
ncbi:MAG TPA: hypothetical protein VJS12_21885 [Steroidobacteraceae bacterium]|nr:hypothetical protein [Steroidobacteraceae bacterium]